MQSFKKPTHQQIDAVLSRLRSPEFCAYFLGRLENPEWILPLREAKVFANPPLPLETEDGGKSHPHWAASKFLARMAQIAPDSVADVFSAIETENGSVIGDMLDASLAMPPHIAPKLAPQISRALRSGNVWIQFSDASELCRKLADGNELDAAMELADALFAPRPGLARAGGSRHDLYLYREGLQPIVPLLASRAAEHFLPKICDWLDATIRAAERSNPESNDDYSCVWRPAIEEHEQNSDHEIRAALVGLVRSAFEIAIHADQLKLLQALSILSRHSLNVFSRLRVHLIGEFAEQALDLFRSTAMDRSLFDDHRLKHEYAVLMGKRFDLLAPHEQSQWLGWVDDGPDMTHYEENFQRWHERSPTSDERRERIEYWQFEKLHLIRNHLEGKYLAFYNQMLSTHGEPTMADLNVRSGPMRWGSESPFSIDQLSAVSFERALDMVTTWQGERDSFDGPDVEGLASVFEHYIAKSPTTFSSEAGLLINQPAIFVRAFIRKMADAINAGQMVSLGPVLELCRWVVDQPMCEGATPDDSNVGAMDKDWQWTRDEVSRLVASVCEAKIDDGPMYDLKPYRDVLWQLLNALYRDPARSYIVHDAAQEDLRTHDYLDLAINSPRGRAVEAGLEYARWVANHIKVKEGEREVVADGFNAMPEVREMLEWQISQGNRSIEALAMIGSRIPLLNWIDKSWLGANADRLFDLSEFERSAHGATGWAAWNAFVVWISPHTGYYRLFESQYAYAVQQCADLPLSDKSRHHPMNHLGQHLMMLYGRGQLELDGALMREFLATANPDVRRHSIGFVGQALEGEEAIPRDVVGRFMALWEVYWKTVGPKDAEQRPDAWLFGPWFGSGVFPTEWALSQLQDFVRVVGVAEPDHDVVEQLAKVANSDPTRSVQILNDMARRDREGWRTYGWRESMKTILGLAIKQGSDARITAVALIDYLGRRGYSELGALLEARG